jgi:hypothetical protein
MFKRHLWGWVIFTLIFIIGSTMLDKSIVSDQVILEQEMVHSFMKESSASRIRIRTNSSYSFCCNWIADFTRTLFVPSSSDDNGVFDAMAGAHQAFWTSIYLVIYRLYILVEWLLVFWVVFVACLMQGFVKRDIAVANTAWSSPIRYHTGLHFALAIIGIQLNLFFCPWALHPVVPVLMLTVFSYVLFIITSNIQHKV